MSIPIFVVRCGDKHRTDLINKQLIDVDFDYIDNNLSKNHLMKAEKILKNLSQKYRQKAIMSGEIGCWIGHKKCWRKASKSVNGALIIEDSAKFIKPISTILSKKITKELITYSVAHKNFGKKKYFGTRCYYLSKQAANRLINASKKTKYCMPIDKWLTYESLSDVYPAISNTQIVTRAAVTSIANKEKGLKNKNIFNLFCLAYNKYKYKY